MRGNVIIVVLLLMYSILVSCQDENSAPENETPKNISGRIGSGVWDEVTLNQHKAALGINMTDEQCHETDYGDGYTGTLCIKYDLYGCIKFKPNDTILEHRGTKEFGQKCNDTGGEDACILLSPKTVWNYKNYDVPGIRQANANCRRRTSLSCHGFYKKCFCGTKEIPGEWFQYNSEDKMCYIRPGFPCINDYDCDKKTRCERIYIADDDEDEDPHWEPLCNCDFEYELGPEDIDTSDLNNWKCGVALATKKRGLLNTPYKFGPRSWEGYKKGDNITTNNGGIKIGMEVSNLVYILYGLLLKVLIRGKVDLD